MCFFSFVFFCVKCMCAGFDQTRDKQKGCEVEQQLNTGNFNEDVIVLSR